MGFLCPVSLGREACGGREAGKCFQHVLSAQRLHSDISSSPPRRPGPSGPSCFPLHPVCTESRLRAVTLIRKGRQDRRRWDERLDTGTHTITFIHQLINCPDDPWAQQQTGGSLWPHWLLLEGLGKQGACWLVGTGPTRRPWLGRPRLAETLGRFATILCVRCLWCLTTHSRRHWPHLP